MTKPTGRPVGRPKGAKNKLTTKRAKIVEKVAKAIESVVPDAFTGDAHALLMAIYKDPSQPWDRRLAAASSAMTREKPALAAIDVTSQNEHIVHTVMDKPIDRTGETWLETHSQPH